MHTGLSSDADYVEAQDRVRDIQLQISATDREIQDAHSNKKTQRCGMADAADAVVNGMLEDIGGIDYEDAVAKLRRRRRVLCEALPRAEAKRRAEHTRASRQICEKARPEYIKRVQRLALACKELASAIATEREFRDSLVGSGVALVGLQSVNMGGDVFDAFDMSQAGSGINVLLSDAQERYGVRV